ncbi:hypothetical protein Tco_0108160, partial [Tanacetum coccineum]
MKTITTLLPPPQPQQSTPDLIFVKRIDNSYKAHDIHNDLYEALQKSLELDYSNQHLAGVSGAPVKGSKALSSSKTVASASQSMAWTTSNTRYESAGVSGDQDLSPTEAMMQDDSIPNEQ